MTISLSIFLVRNENGNGFASYLGEKFFYLFVMVLHIFMALVKLHLLRAQMIIAWR